MSYSPSPETLERVARAVALYPQSGAALLPVLRIIQDEAGFIPPEAERWAAGRLGLSPVRVREVVTFYTMLRRRPAGRTVIGICRNLSCALAGAVKGEQAVGGMERKALPDPAAVRLPVAVTEPGAGDVAEKAAAAGRAAIRARSDRLGDRRKRLLFHFETV